MHILSGGPGRTYKVIRMINQPAMWLILLAECSAGNRIFKTLKMVADGIRFGSKPTAASGSDMPCYKIFSLL